MGVHLLFENHGFVAVEHHAVLAVPFHGSGQHLAFGVAAHRRQVFDGLAVVGARHVLLADLDEGPIIEQDVARVDHSKSVEDLTTLGRDTESQVLARAVKWHSEHRVLINGHKTVIFK